MEGKHSGSCLCGAVQYEVEGTLELFYLCHCEYCRKDTGSAHAANLFSSIAKLNWITGEDKVKSYTLPTTRHAKGFCSICGSALPIVQGNGKYVLIPAGSMNTEVPIKPTAHIFVASKASWDEGLESVPKVSQFPE